MDKDLIIRIRRGDRAAFEVLCRQQYASLIAFARLFLHSSWAEDVVQDALFGLWKHRKDIKDTPGGVESYLLRSVYNTSINYIKRKKHYEKYSSEYRHDIDEMMVSYFSPDKNPVIEAIFKAENRAIVSHAIEQLSPKCREVFKLSFYGNLSNKQIAEKLGIALSTVENHKYLAMKELRLQLQNAGL